MYRLGELKVIHNMVQGVSKHCHDSQFDSDHGVDFYPAYILPIRDLWTAFCVLLSFVFYGEKIINNVAFCPRLVVYTAVSH